MINNENNIGKEVFLLNIDDPLKELISQFATLFIFLMKIFKCIPPFFISVELLVPTTLQSKPINQPQ